MCRKPNIRTAAACCWKHWEPEECGSNVFKVSKEKDLRIKVKQTFFRHTNAERIYHQQTSSVRKC